MEPDERIARFLDDLTAGLKDDPELRLDVRAELASHIEELTASLRAEGKTPEESLELALKAFGSPADIAADLAAANRRRMRLRALARLAARALLVPTAVVLAVALCWRSVVSGVPLLREGLSAAYQSPGQPLKLDYAHRERVMQKALTRLPTSARFLLLGDETRPTRPEQQRAIWEAHPDNKAYYGNYITCLFADPLETASNGGLAQVEEELRRGEALDPDNARYNFLLAAIWARRAVRERWVTVRTPDGREEAQEEVGIRHRALLDRAMAELLKAARKPYWRTYARDMLLERLRLLPPMQRLEDEMVRIGLLTTALLSDLSYRRGLLRLVRRYAECLIGEGRAAVAQPYLEAWRPLVLKWNDDACTMTEVLLTGADIKVGSRDSAAVYERLGQAAKAEETRRLGERLYKPLNDWLTRNRVMDSNFDDEVFRSASTHDRALLAALGRDSLAETDVARGRQLEHVFLEHAGVAFCMLVLLSLMFGALIASLRWRLARGMPSAPMLLLPGWRTALRILLLAVLLPMAAFYLYTRWSGLAGREFAFGYLWHRFALELALLAATIAALAFSMARRAVRRRCERLGIAVPRPPGRLGRAIAWGALAALWVACLSMRRPAALLLPEWAIGHVVLHAALVPVLGAGLLGLHLGFGSREHGLYRGTVARSLIPVFAAAAIVLGAVAHPYLASREAALAQANEALSGQGELLGLTRAEALLIQRLKDGVRRAAAELQTAP